METNLAQLEGTPKQIAWAEKIRARKLEKLAEKKRHIFMACVPYNGKIVKSISPECALEVVKACPSAYSFILTRNRPLDFIIAQSLLTYTGDIY